MTETPDCPICFGESNIILECLHHICNKCFIRLTTKLCPLCRTVISNSVYTSVNEINRKKIIPRPKIIQVKNRHKKYFLGVIEINERYVIKN